jgi:hypothetical protein
MAANTIEASEAFFAYLDPTCGFATIDVPFGDMTDAGS